MASLQAVLQYIFRFYATSAPRIYIADGSDPTNQAILGAYLREVSHDIVHLKFSPNCSFLERVAQGLREVDSSTVIMNADDDFPFLEQLKRCDDLLAENAEAVSVMGGTVNLMFERSGFVSSFLNVTRTIDDPDPLKRCATFSFWPYSTTYGVTRKLHLLERYAWCANAPRAGYFDFAIGLHDLLAGTIIALPHLTHVATRNYSHAYWRKNPDSTLGSELEDISTVAENLSSAVVRRSDFSWDEAQAWCLGLFKERFLGNLGAPGIKQPGFWSSSESRDPGALEQIDLFRQFSRSESAFRSLYNSRIEYVRSAIGRTIASNSQATASDYAELG